MKHGPTSTPTITTTAYSLYLLTLSYHPMGVFRRDRNEESNDKRIENINDEEIKVECDTRGKYGVYS